VLVRAKYRTATYESAIHARFTFMNEVRN
jgi:hypothetical protein